MPLIQTVFGERVRIVTIVVGIVGAIVGGFVMQLLGFGDVNGINIWSILVATGGAILVLLVVGALRR